MENNLEVWEDIHATHEWGKYPSEHVIRFVARNYYRKKRSNIKILDFGCGAGANTFFLAREGFDVYAFDGAPSAVRKANRYLQEQGYNDVHFTVQNGRDLEYTDNYFDCVIDNVCICSNIMTDIKEMYKEIYRVLKPQGKIYTSCFSTNTFYGGGVYVEKGTYNNIEEGVLAERGIVHIYTEEELYNIMENVCFKNIVIDYDQYSDNGNKVEILMAKAEK